MMKETKMKRVPKLRFPEFTDDWEQRKLLNCVQKVIDFRGRTPKKLGMEWSDRGYLALSALNVKDGYIDFDQDVHYGDKTLYDKWMTGNELHQGQVLFTTEAPMGNVAQVPDNRRYILSQRTIAFEVNENIITENFLATILRTPAVFDTLTALSSGGTAKGVSQKSLATVDICIPQNLDEQIKLADYFSHLDHLITLHQRKYERLQVLKKAMLEKMFPKNGSKVPEIRFEGFTDDWEQRKLTEFVEFFSGLTYTPSDVQENGTLVLRSSNVSNGEIVDADNVYVNSKVVNSENVKVGDIIVVVRNGSRSLIGKHAQIKTFMPNTVIGAFMTGIRSECPEFTNALLNTPKFEEEIAMNMGATINQITGYMFSKMEFKVPCLEEQKKIGTYFKHLDHLITLHQRQLEKLQNIKKSMLEKMFV